MKEIEVDRAASSLWVTFVRTLQENKIEWESLLSKEKQDFSSDILAEALIPPRFPYTPSFKILNHKQKKGTHEGHSYHLFDLEILFTANQKELTFPYSIFIERNLNVGGDKKE